MKRREFISLLGGAGAAWPLTARAQEPAMPVIGYLVSGSAEGYADTVAAVREGLSAAGYIEGRNVTVEYRYADEELDRLPALAADLVRRRVAVIFATGSVLPALAAKAATTTIPIVFSNGSDPVALGLVASLNRPGSNATGVSLLGTELTSKRLELLREVIPNATVVALLVNPGNPNAGSAIAGAQAAARTIGVKLLIANASSGSDLDAAFAGIVQQRAEGLIVAVDPLFNNRREELIILAARYALPAISYDVSLPRIGGLMAYGADAPDMLRQAGVYIGRILKGEKPADLPVVQPTKFDLVINLKTAKALGLKIPEAFLLRADEVIE